MASRICAYVGSFDPLTLGHVDLIERSLNMFDRVVIGVGTNSNKAPMFDLDRRIDLIYRGLNATIDDAERITHCEGFNGLAIDFARKHGACAIIRGLRNITDYAYEHQFAHVNMRMAPEIEHVYFMASEKDHFVSSSIVKELWLYGTAYKEMVPGPVFDALEKKKEENNAKV